MNIISKDDISLGPVPAEESCQQVGTPGYDSAEALRECMAFREQLLRQCGEPPDGAAIRITSNVHDFGSYYDVVVSFDNRKQKAIEWAFMTEAECPVEWDEEARTELGL